MYSSELSNKLSWDCTHIKPDSKFRVALPTVAGGSDFVLSVVFSGDQSLQASCWSPGREAGREAGGWMRGVDERCG